jgi:hypothetical protein
MKNSIKNLVFTFATLFSFNSQAGYLAIHESGEILPDNGYQFGLAPQLLLNNGGGGNFDAFIDAPLNESSSFRVQTGVGKVDFHLSAGIKYIPFPDVDQQPAIGAKVSAWYARVSSENIMTVQIAPLISRRFNSEHEVFVPYIALPININNGKDRNWTGTQFVIGSEWRNPEFPNILTGAELSMSLNDSYSSLSAFLAFPFDGQRGFRRK